MIIYSYINKTIIESFISAFFPHDKQSCRLLSSAISSCFLTSSQSCNQAIAKKSSRLFECACHCEHGILSYQDVTLTCKMFSNVAASPGKTLFPSISGGCAGNTDNSYLALSSFVIITGELNYY